MVVLGIDGLGGVDALLAAAGSPRGGGQGFDGAPFHPGSSDERDLVYKIILKVADLSHTAASWTVHKRWVGCLQEVGF